MTFLTLSRSDAGEGWASESGPVARFEWAALGVVLAFIALRAYAKYFQGLAWVFEDDAIRIQLASSVAAGFEYHALGWGFWLPLTTHFHALAILALPLENDLAVMTANLLVSLLVVVFVHLLGRDLAGPGYAMAGTLALGGSPAFLQLTSSALSEPIYLLLQVGGFWVLGRSLRAGQRWGLPLAALMFMGAQATRYEAWGALPLVFGVLALVRLREGGVRGLAMPGACVALTLFYPVAWTVASWMWTGTLLADVAGSRTMLQEELNAHVGLRMLQSLPLTPFAGAVLAVVGLVALDWRRHWRVALAPAAAGLFHLAFLLWTVAEGSAGFPPERFVTVPMVLLMPFAAVGMRALLERARGFSRVRLVLALLLVLGGQMVFVRPNPWHTRYTMRMDAIELLRQIERVCPEAMRGRAVSFAAPDHGDVISNAATAFLGMNALPQRRIEPGLEAADFLARVPRPGEDLLVVSGHYGLPLESFAAASPDWKLLSIVNNQAIVIRTDWPCGVRIVEGFASDDPRWARWRLPIASEPVSERLLPGARLIF
ncbi:MAG: hypothetical protein RLY93_00850 [Sumerlaeia bacterium]